MVPKTNARLAPAVMFQWLAVFLALQACAGMPPSEVTRHWQEEVALRTGETIVVDRSIRQGDRRLWNESVSFRWRGRTVSWQQAGPAFFDSSLLAIDVVDDAPIVIFPVTGVLACKAYDYPPEGIAAVREERGKWVPMGLRSLPPEIRVNLLREYGSRKSDEGVITMARKAALAEHLTRIGQRGGTYGFPLPEYVAEAGKRPDSCRSLKGWPPDSGLAASMRELKLVEEAATFVVAKLVSSEQERIPISAVPARGRFGLTLVKDDCGDAVRDLETRGQSFPATMVIQLAPGTPESRIGLSEGPLRLIAIGCDDQAIVLVRRSGIDRVLVHRFHRSGRPIDATWVELPGAREITGDGRYPPIRDLDVAGTKVTLVFAAFDRPLDKSSMVRKKTVYEATIGAR